MRDCLDRVERGTHRMSVTVAVVIGRFSWETRCCMTSTGTKSSAPESADSRSLPNVMGTAWGHEAIGDLNCSRDRCDRWGERLDFFARRRERPREPLLLP